MADYAQAHEFLESTLTRLDRIGVMLREDSGALARLDFAKDAQVTYKSKRGGYKKTGRTIGDTIEFNGAVYQGNRDGWIAKFWPHNGENLTVFGDTIDFFEIPLKKIVEFFSPDDVMNLLAAINDKLNLSQTSVADLHGAPKKEPEPKSTLEERYKDHKRFGAFA